MREKSLRKKTLQILITVVVFLLSIVCFFLSFKVFNINTNGVILSFGDEGIKENIETIGSADEGIFITTYYENDGEEVFKARKLGENNQVIYESVLNRYDDGTRKDNGNFRGYLSISKNRVLAYTQSWYYLYESSSDGLRLLDSFNATLDVSVYTYDYLSQGNLNIYNLQTRGSSSTAQVYVEKISIVNDSFVSSVNGEIKKVRGNRNKSLDHMGATAMGLTVTPDHNNLIIVTSSALALMIDTDLSILSITDAEIYSEKQKSINLVDNIGNTVTCAKDINNSGELYVGLQNCTYLKLTAADFANSDEKPNNVIAKTAEYGNCMFIDSVENIMYVSNQNGNTVYVVDLKKEKLLFGVKLQFKISSIVTCAESNAFMCQWQDTVSNKFYVSSYDLNSLEKFNTNKKWRIASIVLGIITAIIAIMLFLSIVSAKIGACVLQKGKLFLRGVWQSKLIYLIILPSFTLLVMFSLYPSIASVINSFFDYELGKPKIFVGLENYRELFVLNQTLILEVARNTVLMVATYIFTQVVPPVFYAYLINLLRNKNSVKVIRFFLYIPGLLPTIASMLMWRYGVYGINPNGAINTIIVNVFGGTPIPFLGSSDYAIWSILFIGFPWVGGFLLFYGALMAVPGEVYDALEIEGCGIIRRFFSIDLHYISGQIKYVSIGALIAGVKSVGRVMATTGGTMGTMTMMYKLYDYLTQNRYGMASAIAVIMVVLLAGISLARVRKMLKKEATYD